MKTKHLIVITLITLLGLLGNKLFNLSLFSPNTVRMARFDMKGFEVKPYQRGNLEGDRDAQAFLAKTKAYRLARAGTFQPGKMANAPAVTQPAVKTTAAQAKKDPKKEAADKKKKALAAKKKKEREKRRNGIINNYEQDAYAARPSNSDRRPTQNDSNDVYAGAGSSTTVAAAVAQAKKDKDAKDLQEWKDLLLASPNKVNTIEFIRAFQLNEISEETFYAIITLMYAERTSDFQSLAVMAAGSVSNIRSFDFLVSVFADQSQGSIVAASSEREIQEYSAISALTVIRQVLNARQEDELKMTYAARVMDDSTETYLSSGSAAPAPALSPMQKQIFASIIPALENVLSLHASNTQITEPGKRALDRIKGISPVVAQNQNP